MDLHQTLITDEKPIAEPPFVGSHPVHQAWFLLFSGQALGVLASRYLGGESSRLPLFFALFWVVSLAFAGLSKSARRPLLTSCLLGGLCLGCMRYQNLWWVQAPDNLGHLLVSDHPRLLTFRGWVIARENFQTNGLIHGESSTSSCRLIILANAVAGDGSFKKCSGRILLETSADIADQVAVGNHCQLTGWAELLQESMNPGSVSSADYWKAQGVSGTVQGQSHLIFASDTASQPIYWRMYREKLRQSCRAALRDSLDEKTAALVEALVLGIRESVALQDRLAFKDTGTLHLLAISGLHLQVVAVFVMSLARRMRLNLTLASFLVIVSSLFYAMMVTGGASVARAVCMSTAVALAAIRCRPGHFWHRLFMAGVIVIWLRPSFLFDAGAQLSFVGTAGIYLSSILSQRLMAVIGRTNQGHSLELVWQLYQKPAFFEDHDRANSGLLQSSFKALWLFLVVCGNLTKLLIEACLISTSVWLITSILVAFHFGKINPIAILANLPLVPMTSLSLISGLSGFIMHGLGMEWPGSWIFMLSGWLMSLSVDLLNQSLEWGMQPWHTPKLDSLSVAGFYLLIFIATYLMSKGLPQKKRIFLILAPIVWLLIIPAMSSRVFKAPIEHLQLEMMAVDHGLAVLVQWPDGENWLYDCGQMNRPQVGSLIVAPALKARSVNHLDKLFLSHADADHFNGVASLLDSGISVQQVLTTPQFLASRQPDALSLKKQLSQHQIQVSTVVAGTVLKQTADGSAKIAFPHNDVPLGRADNATSLVLEIESFGINCMLTGDLEDQSLLELAMSFEAGQRDRQTCDVLMAPHHGGISSNPTWFYDKLKPKLVLSSQGRSRFGMAAGLQKRIQEYCPESPLLVTANDGAIRLQWRPDGLKYESFCLKSVHKTGLLLRDPTLKRRLPRSAEFVLNP
jgi:competence protein ComEC